MDAVKTGKLIYEARNEVGLSQQELAEKLHITRTTVSKWENGRGLPDISLLESLGDALGLSVTELIHGERNPAETGAEQTAREMIRLSGIARRMDRRRTWLLAAAILLLLVAVAVFLPKNPWKSFSTLEEAEAYAGVVIDSRPYYEEYPMVAIDAAREVGFRAKKGIVEVYWNFSGATCRVRKGVGTRDVSGDHRKYSDIQEIAGFTAKGENGKYRLAVWQADGYSYAIMIDGYAEVDGHRVKIKGIRLLDLMAFVQKVH